MSTTAMHPLAADYLRRLRHVGRELPAGRLDDLCAEIESHLAEAIPVGASDADALSVIERLGSPEEIVEAEQPAPDAEAPASADRDPRSWREWAAIVLLPLGGFALGVGWVAGVILLWSSRAWSTRDKVIATLIVPGGIAAFFPVLLLSATATETRCVTFTSQAANGFGSGFHRCTPAGGPSALHVAITVIVLAIVVVGPILVAIHLARAARRAPAI